MNAGDHPVIGMADVLNTTGAFTMEIPCPRSRSTATIRWVVAAGGNEAGRRHMARHVCESAGWRRPGADPAIHPAASLA